MITFYIKTYPKKTCRRELFNFSFWLDFFDIEALFWCNGASTPVVVAWSRTRQQNVNKKKVKIKSWITSFGNIILGKLLYEKWSGKTHKQSIFNETKLPFKSKLSYYLTIKYLIIQLLCLLIYSQIDFSDTFWYLSIRFWC